MATVTEPSQEVATTTVTAHAIKRCRERFSATENMADAQVQLFIIDSLRQAAWLFYGSCGNSNEANFYCWGDTIFVVKDNMLITLYKAEYGFGEEIDDSIRRKLVTSIKNLHAKIDKAEERLRTTHSNIDHEINTIADRLRVLVAEVKMLEDARTTLFAKKQETVSEKGLLEAKLVEEVAKLVQSKRYNTEMLAAMKEVAAPTNGKK